MPTSNLDKHNDKYGKLGRLINGAVSWDEKTYTEVGAVLGLKWRAAKRYLKNPEKMTVEQLLKLSRRLNIPIDDLRATMRY
jgi:hypothetical protein